MGGPSERLRTGFGPVRARDLDGAMRTLFQLLSDHPDDGPGLVLLSRVIALRDTDSTEFDPVWELPGK